MEFLLDVFTRFLIINDKITTKCSKNSSKVPRMFISSAFFQKYERFVDKPAKVLMAETVAQTSDRMFVEIINHSTWKNTW